MENARPKEDDLPLFGRGNMSRGRKALIFAGVGLLLFILPWFIVGDLLASNLALVIVLVRSPDPGFDWRCYGVLCISERG
jgi:hypothetical protein